MVIICKNVTKRVKRITSTAPWSIRLEVARLGDLQFPSPPMTNKYSYANAATLHRVSKLQKPLPHSACPALRTSSKSLTKSRAAVKAFVAWHQKGSYSDDIVDCICDIRRLRKSLSNLYKCLRICLWRIAHIWHENFDSGDANDSDVASGSSV